MEDHEVLQHLINLEKEASLLVNEAQAEADKRISGAEKENRLLHENTCAREAESLEKHYTQYITAVKDDYSKQLEAYSESLKSMSVNMENFSCLAEKLMIIKETGYS